MERVTLDINNIKPNYSIIAKEAYCTGQTSDSVICCRVISKSDLYPTESPCSIGDLIVCRGNIPQVLINGETYRFITKQEEILAIVKSNAKLKSEWIEENLVYNGEKVKLYDHQRKMIDNTSDTKISVCGRQSGLTMAMGMDMIATAISSKCNILYIAPYSAQIRVMSDILTRVHTIDNNNIVVTSTCCGGDCSCRMGNDSLIKLAASGSRSNHKSYIYDISSYDYIYVDCAAYVSNDTIDYVLWSKAKIWYGTSPKDIDTCRVKALYSDPGLEAKKFNYPSRCNPNFTEETDLLLKKSYSERAYKLDILADWS